MSECAGGQSKVLIKATDAVLSISGDVHLLEQKLGSMWLPITKCSNNGSNRTESTAGV